jgi:hypothetical protein
MTDAQVATQVCVAFRCARHAIHRKSSGLPVRLGGAHPLDSTLPEYGAALDYAITKGLVKPDAQNHIDPKI